MGEFIITHQNGTDSIPEGSFGTLTFGDCELEIAGGFCEMTQTLEDGRTYVISYQVQVSAPKRSGVLQLLSPEGGIGPDVLWQVY